MERAIDILMVEDNAADIRLTQEAFKEGRLPSTLHVVRNGIDALAFMRKQEPFADAPVPDLVLLDLNLPRKDGREVLAELKQDPDLRRIPVVILTTSRAESDIVKSYDLHANSYIVKPMELAEFFAVMRSIEDFWLTTTTLPPE